MVLFANAKINIGLQVVAKRIDGYHELNTVFYPFPVYDVIELHEIDSSQPIFHAAGIAVPGRKEDNLCLQAYKLLQQDFDIPAVRIDMIKQIPVGAGLGGGSSDASAVLKGTNALFHLGLSPDQLESYAARLGADCPFFIRNKPVFATGIGNDFADISLDLSNYFIVMIQPDVHISTAEAYSNITPSAPGYQLDKAIQLPVQEWKFHIGNDFEQGIFELHPVIKAVKEAFYGKGAIYASMSGSGSAVYGIFREQVDLGELVSFGQIYYPAHEVFSPNRDLPV